MSLSSRGEFRSRINSDSVYRKNGLAAPRYVKACLRELNMEGMGTIADMIDTGVLELSTNCQDSLACW